MLKMSWLAWEVGGVEKGSEGQGQRKHKLLLLPLGHCRYQCDLSFGRWPKRRGDSR